MPSIERSAPQEASDADHVVSDVHENVTEVKMPADEKRPGRNVGANEPPALEN